MTEQKKQTTKKNTTKEAPTEAVTLQNATIEATQVEGVQEAESPAVELQDVQPLEDIFTKTRIVNSIIEMESANANMVEYFNKLVTELTALQKDIEEKEAALKDDPNAPLHEKKINEQKVAYGALYKRLKLTEQRVQAVSMILEELDEKLLRG